VSPGGRLGLGTLGPMAAHMSRLADGSAIDPAPSARDDRSGAPRAVWSWAARHRDILAVAAIAVLARGLYWAFATPGYVPASDAGQYDEIARNLAAGRGFAMHFPQLTVHATAFRPPLYPALLALVYRVFGPSIVAGRLLNLAIGVAVVVMTVAVGEMVANRRAGLIAGLAVALYPPLMANDVALLTEPLSLLLVLSMVLALGRRRPLVAAVLCGLLILARPSAQGIALVVAAWLIWQVGWRTALRFVVIAGLVVVPWVVRNWVQLGSPLLVTSNGFNLAAMYSPAARARGSFVDPVYDPSFDKLRLAQFDEVGWQSQLERIATTSLRQHPSQVVQVFARNAAAFAELRPSFNRDAEIEDGRNLTFRTWTLPVFYLVTVVGLVGVGLRWRDPIMKLLVLMTAYFALVSLVLVAPPRLRAPFDLLCCIGVGIAIDAALRRRRTRQVTA
jgi:4-amino-4-deoxy-L-arabinose transferase-like glycosyltransferase